MRTWKAFLHIQEGIPAPPDSSECCACLGLAESAPDGSECCLGLTLSRLLLPGSVPSTGAGVHFHLLYCAVGLGLVGMLLEAIGEKVAEAEEAAVEGVAEAVEVTSA